MDTASVFGLYRWTLNASFADILEPSVSLSFPQSG